MLATDAPPAQYGVDEAGILRALRPSAPLRAQGPGWRARAESRSSAHLNPSEGPGGSPALALRQDASLLAWWRPWGPDAQLLGSLDARGRSFLGAYGPDALGSANLLLSQRFWGPFTAYGGLGALASAGGLAASSVGWATASAGLSAGLPWGPWEAGAGYQLDRVLASGGLMAWAHTGRLACAWRPDAAWQGAGEWLLQARPGAEALQLRHRLTFSLDHAWPSGWEVGAFVQAVGSGDQALSDLALGPRLRWGFR